jgi:predicted RNA-binding Zn-ribbon protein involved in translation (DUF1610 family)
MSFIAKPIHQAGESLRGYIRRLADAMSVYTVRELDVVLESGTGRLHEQDSETLGSLFDLQPSAVDFMRYGKVPDKRLSFRGVPLPSHFLVPTKVRICPECIAENSFHRQVWDLAFVHDCPLHKLPLLDHCPSCHHKISWEHTGLIACTSCGAEIERKKRQRSSAGDTSTLSRILSWIGGMEGTERPRDVPAVGKEWSFPALMEFVVAMGRAACVEDGIALAPGRSFADPNIGQFLTRGLEIADEWPQRFRNLIDRRLGRTERSGSMTVQLGHFMHIASHGSKEWRGIVRSELIDALARHPHVPCQPNGDFGKEVLKRRGRCTLKEAQEILAVDQKRFASIRDSDAWKAIEASADGAGLLLTQAVDDLAQEIDGVMSMAELGTMLGLADKDHLRRIANCSVFKTMRNQGHYDQRTKHICKSDAAAFVDIINRAPPKKASDFRLVGFKEAVALACQRGIEIGQVAELIGSGDLVAACRDGKAGLSGLFFNKADALGFFDQLAAKQMGSISVREAANELLILEREAYQLAKLGFLETTYMQGKGNLRGQRVLKRDLEEFDAVYVSAKKLAVERGEDLQAVRGWIRRELRFVANPRVHQRVEVFPRRLFAGG